MKRIILAGIVLFSLTASASADQLIIRWYDTIRPHGQKRPDAVGEAAVEHCNQTFGVQYDYVSRAFKACMARQGYRFMSARMTDGGGGGSVTYNRDSRNPSVGWHNEGGFRVCHNDCDNPEAPGSGYTCSNVQFMGTTMRKCEKDNHM
jgi:hypothetical protein